LWDPQGLVHRQLTVPCVSRYWESVESLRRVLLSGVLAVVYPQSITQTLCGIALTYLSMLIYSTSAPYLDPLDQVLMDYTLFSTLLTLVGGWVGG
jgi:hypothetical protein